MDEAFVVVCKRRGEEKAITIPLTLERAVEWIKKFALQEGKRLGIKPSLSGKQANTRAVVWDVEFYLKLAY